MKKSKRKKTVDKKKIWGSVIACIAVLVLVIGFSRAWFYNEMDMETLMRVSGPSEIAILGPNGAEMTSLDLSYTDSNKDSDGKVTVRRVICVQSESDAHQLEIVHTTNLKGLTFKLYEAEEAQNAETDKTGGVTEDGLTYKYNPAQVVSGVYINQETTVESEYKYANAAKHEQNFSESDNVQSHAEPLYWKTTENLQASSKDDVTIDNRTKHRTYYVCEISWTETTKETDIFYILAKTV